MKDGGQLISSFSILKYKRDDSVTKVANRSPKIDLFYIVRVHLNLIIATKTIHEGEQANSDINQHLYVR